MFLGKPSRANDQPENRWQAAGISVQGISHLKNRVPCQDAHIWRKVSGEAIVLAVADGAGSAPLSQVGAARAAVAAVDWVDELLKEAWPANKAEWRQLLAASLQTAHESVRASAERRKVPARELATTLIVAVATPGLAAAIQVGDGACVVVSDTGEVIALTAPHHSEFVNETIFFTSPDYLDVAQFGLCARRISGIAALSDGLQLLALKMPEAEPHAAFFRPLLRLVADAPNTQAAEDALRAFLRSERITQRADDDLTLVLATLNERREHAK